MIIDKIENSKLYLRLSDKIAKAFAYIEETDFSKISAGKYEIVNDSIFALVQEYDTKEKSECKLEGHNKYIDVQYIINGVELIGIASLKKQQPVIKNDESDFALYEGESEFIRLDEGMFTIFFPDDLHMPGIKLNQISKVKKVVVKVKI